MPNFHAVLKRFALFALCAALSTNLIAVAPVHAQQGGLPIVRDAEIEAMIWSFTVPILGIAGIDPAATTLQLVPSRALNAFVAGGPNIFINTGLLMRADNPEQVIGVIAHEVGHIAGAHGIRTRDLMEDLQLQGIITMILGVALAAATGEGGLAAASVMGSQGLMANAYLAHSRAQESAADQAGVSYLEGIGVSARGLRDFLAVLEKEEYLAVGRQSPYFRTHPVTRRRIDFIEEHISKSRYSDARLPDYQYRWFDIMQAKLSGFLNPPSRTLRDYPATDKSVPARYARAIAYYRIPNLDKALPLIDGLIADDPENPYYRELKGQMLFENGRVAEAIEPYRNAVRLSPGSPLLRTQMAQVLLESGDPLLNGVALSNLKESARRDNGNGLTWHLLSIAYGRAGDIGMAALSIAEKALLEGDRKTAIGQARRAMHMLREGTRGWLRAESILTQADDMPS